MSTTTRMVLSLFLAVTSGLLLTWLAPDTAATLANVLQPLGKLWLNALQMTVVPLVGALVTLAVGSARDAAASGRTTRRALVVFIVLLVFSGTVAATVAPVLFHLAPRSPDLMAALAGAGGGTPAAAPAPADWLTNIIPSNAINAAAQGAMLPLVVFALFFGFALTRIEPTRSARMVELLHAIADAMTVIVRWVLLVAPLGVFALVFAVTARTGVHMVAALGVYLLVAIAVYLLVTAAMYGVVAVAGRDRVADFARGILPAQAVAVSTQSSLASLPAMVECARDRLKQPLRVPSLVLPMAVSLFRLTSPVQYLVVASFIAWVHGTDLHAMQIATAVLLAAVVSMGSVGLPGQASFMATNLPITQSLGLPIEPLGILLAVDTIPDVFATLGNVTADLAASSVAGRGEPDDAPDQALDAPA